MISRFRFSHDATYDVVTAAFDELVLHTEADALEWEQIAGRLLSEYGRKVDLLIDLSGLHVKGPASSAFGAARARVLETFSRHSVRFGAEESTAAFIYTSSVINDAPANLYATREEALEHLLTLRRRASQPPVFPRRR